jgi:ABC-type dipeptide/oligopeptide/nickel transport system permease subunit
MRVHAEAVGPTMPADPSLMKLAALAVAVPGLGLLMVTTAPVEPDVVATVVSVEVIEFPKVSDPAPYLLMPS